MAVEEDESTLTPSPPEVSPLCPKCLSFLQNPCCQSHALPPKGATSWVVSDKLLWSPCEIYKSADEGCHLCSLVAGEMLFPVRLAYKGAKDQIHEDGTIFLALQRSTLDKELKMQVSYVPPGAGMEKTRTEDSVNGYFNLNLFAVLPYKVARSDLRQEERVASNGTGSMVSLDIAKGWVDECLREHPRCAQHKTERSFPSRVIDVGVESSIKPRLVEASGISPEQLYAVLSYCWGPPQSQQLKLLSTNYDSFRRAIDPRQLPLTLHDAMTASHGLGVRYIWIDSLCIIQDSPEDWNRQAAKMAKVYEHAIFCISATAASDSAKGFFRDRDPLSSFTRRCLVRMNVEESRGASEIRASDVRIDEEEQILRSATDLSLKKSKGEDLPRTNSHPNTDDSLDPSQYFYFIPYQQWSRDVENTPLTTRGWVVQEHFLPSRILHFGTRQLLWECRTKRASECLSAGVVLPSSNWQNQKYTNHHVASDVYLVQLQILGVSWPANVASIRNQLAAPDELWRNVVALYSQRRLAFASDRLVALHGVAGWLAAATGDEYLVGLWRRHLPMELMWRPETGRSRTCRYRAPSWSWVSMDGSVLWWGEHMDSQRRPMLVVEDVVLEYEKSDILRRGEMRCSGRLYKGILTATTLIVGNIMCWGERDDGGPFQTQHECGYHPLDLDSTSKEAHFEVFCAPVHQHDFGYVPGTISGLLLIPTEQSGEFRRVGWFMSEDHRRPEHERFFFPHRTPQWPSKNAIENEKLQSDLRDRLGISGPEKESGGEMLRQFEKPACEQSLFMPRTLGVTERTEIYRKAVMGEEWPLNVGEYKEEIGDDEDGARRFRFIIV